MPRIRRTLVAPPFVHEHEQVATTGPRIVQFEMEIIEKEVEVEPGVFVQGMTFNGSIPGPMMVVHEGDYLELTLKNRPDNLLEHNIDFHSATGGLGGGALTHVQPGEQAVLRWKATRPGVFVYHCAPGGPMIPWHVVSGMSGAVMVLPRNGLTDHRGQPVRYDRVVYIGENDFYVPRDETGAYRRYADVGESYPDTLEVMNGLIPTHVVFNGAVGPLTGDRALTANVGEKVLIIHSQANRDTRPHLIGGHGDLVWEEGKFNNPPARDLETWFIRGGSAGAALYEFLQPGTYAYVNHNLIEAVNLGATAHFVVDGAVEQRPDGAGAGPDGLRKLLERGSTGRGRGGRIGRPALVFGWGREGCPVRLAGRWSRPLTDGRPRRRPDPEEAAPAGAAPAPHVAAAAFGRFRAALGRASQGARRTERMAKPAVQHSAARAMPSTPPSTSLGPTARSSAATAIRVKASVRAAPASRLRPVWPRVARIITAAVMPPMPPIPSRCSPAAAGTRPTPVAASARNPAGRKA